jgi:hypothetical protein
MFQFGGIPYSVQGGNTPSAGGEKIEANFRATSTAPTRPTGRLRVHRRPAAAVQRGALPVPQVRLRPSRRPVRHGSPWILEKPWTGATTGDLLSRRSVDVDLAGQLLRGPPEQRDQAAPAGLGDDRHRLEDGVGDRHGGRRLRVSAGRSGVRRGPGRPVARAGRAFRSVPGPDRAFRGMSWLQPVVEEISADGRRRRTSALLRARARSSAMS